MWSALQAAASLFFTQYQAPSEVFQEKCCHRNKPAVQTARGRPTTMVPGAGTSTGRIAAGVPGQWHGAVLGWRVPCAATSAASPSKAAVVLLCWRCRHLPQVASPPQMHWRVDAETAPSGKLPDISLLREWARRCMDLWDILGHSGRGCTAAGSHPSSAQVMASPSLVENKSKRAEGENQLRGSPAHLGPPTAGESASLPRRGFNTKHAQQSHLV